MSRPFLLVVAGLPGSGKSALCAALGRHLPMQILSTDRIRRELFQVRLHTADESRAVYDELWRRATSALRSDASVAIDATNMTRPQQSTLDWRDLAAQEQVALLGLHLQAGESTLRDRLRARGALAAREDASEATETALPSFVGTGPPSFAVPVDADLFSVEQIAVMVRPLLDGRIDAATAAGHLQTHARLHRTARELELGHGGLHDPTDDDEAWTRALGPIGPQLRRDRSSPDLLGRWGASRTIDENTRAAILAPTVAERLMREGGVPIAWPEAHAGVLHTYGYLLSHAWTPYGFKRDRWVNGDVAAAVGCPPELLGPAPPEGTLLSNLTACLDRVLGHPASEGLPSVRITAPSQVLLLTEEVHAVEGRTVAEPFQLRTYLARGHDPALPEPTLLIYATRSRNVETYVTAFTVSDDYGESLLAGTGPNVTIRPRFNVASPFGEARLAGTATVSTWPA